jgi:hypothetical protein
MRGSVYVCRRVSENVLSNIASQHIVAVRWHMDTRLPGLNETAGFLSLVRASLFGL